MSQLDNSTPIVVPASASAVQIAAAIRQVAMSAGVILGAFGATALSAKAHVIVSVAPEIATILVVVGPIVWGAAMWVGQMATRRKAQDAAAMAAQLPDQVAKLKL